MIPRHELTLEHYRKFEPHLYGGMGRHCGVTRDNHNFLNAVFCIAKTGIPWFDLPARLGKWDTVFLRFNQWSKKGVWKRLFKEVRDPDQKWLFMDSTLRA
jgi:putative transposase